MSNGSSLEEIAEASRRAVAAYEAWIDEMRKTFRGLQDSEEFQRLTADCTAYWQSLQPEPLQPLRKGKRRYPSMGRY